MFGTYDSWKCATPRDIGGVRSRSPGCPICHGGGGTPCSGRCLQLVLAAETRRRIRGLTLTALQCVQLLRQYRAEGDTPATPRTAAVLVRIRGLRDDMAGDRAQLQLYREAA